MNKATDNPIINELLELIAQHTDFLATSPEQAKEGLEQEGWFVAEDEDAAATELVERGWNICNDPEGVNSAIRNQLADKQNHDELFDAIAKALTRGGARSAHRRPPSGIGLIPGAGGSFPRPFHPIRLIVVKNS